MIAETAVIHPNVELGRDCTIEDYAVIGAPPRGARSGDLRTVIGDGAVVRSGTVIYAGNVIGSNFQTGNKVNIRESNEIGHDVSIGTLSIVEHHVQMGNRVRIHSGVFVPEFTVLDDDCWLGPHVVITNAKYPKSPNVKETLKGAHVKKMAMVGANATLLPGVVIGIHSLVGAGSVVTEDVQDETVVAGNPARRIKGMNELPYGKP